MALLQHACDHVHHDALYSPGVSRCVGQTNFPRDICEAERRIHAYTNATHAGSAKSRILKAWQLLQQAWLPRNTPTP